MECQKQGWNVIPLLTMLLSYSIDVTMLLRFGQMLLEGCTVALPSFYNHQDGKPNEF